MTFRLAVHGPSGSLLIALCLLALSGCASRSLKAPPIEDWSNGASAARPASAPLTYTVRREDTLASIAKRFDTTPADLVAWNALGPNPRLQPNQVLIVSRPAAAGPEVAVPAAVTQPIATETVEQRPLGPATPPPPASPLPSTNPNAPLKTGPLGIKRPYSDTALAELSRPDGDAPPAPAAPGESPSAPAASATASTWTWPAAGKPVNAFDGKSKGIDIPGKPGDPIVAAADGKVTFSGTGVRGYGSFIIVQHTPELLSVYAHNRVNLVKEGAMVTKGQRIAEMGNSETDAVKVHFEIRNDSKPVDPLKYLPAR